MLYKNYEIQLFYRPNYGNACRIGITLKSSPRQYMTEMVQNTLRSLFEKFSSAATQHCNIILIIKANEMYYFSNLF